jgi:hypothetical protein
VPEVQSSRGSPVAAIGRGLVLLGAVFLVALLGLLLLFRFNSQPVAAGVTYPWDSDDAVFVQPVDGDLACVVHTAQMAARVTVHRPSGSLIPGELVDRPAGTSVTLTCEQPARIAAGPPAQLYPASGPAGSLVVFGGLVVLGAALWLIGRLRRS